MLTPNQMDDLSGKFERDGYLTLPGVIPSEPLAALVKDLRSEFERVKRAGELFAGGGTISGHLNCFPGAQSRFVYERLEDYGVIDFVRRVSPRAERMPNIGCNFNLPASSMQNLHIDGYAAESFIIINVAAVDTTLVNGAMEARPGSHKRDYRYWELMLAGLPSLRAELKAGDVVIRTSSLWHRGMPNRTKEVRPMLAFTWEDGGSSLADPYTAHNGKITFLTNRYGLSFSGRLRERAFAALPSVGSSYLFLRSLFTG